MLIFGKYILALSLALIALGLGSAPQAQAITSTDLNSDGCVNGADFDILKRDFRFYNSISDIDQDGDVDVFDLSYLMNSMQSGCVPEDLPSGAWGAYDLKITHDGSTRFYTVYIPFALRNGNTPASVVLALHGGTSNSETTRLVTQFDITAGKNGFIAVYPNALGGHWNDGRAFAAASSNDADDVGLMEAILSKLDEQLNIDLSSVYVAGGSNGGMMAFRLACERPSIYAGFAPIIANLPEEVVLSCSPNQPVDMIFIAGTADPLIPYDGGEIIGESIFGDSHGSVISIPDTVLFWVENNNCNTTPTSENIPDIDTTDSSTVTKHTYTGCDAGSRVILYNVDGGGHTWPGQIQILPESIVGPINRDIKASDEILKFFFN